MATTGTGWRALAVTVASARAGARDQVTKPSALAADPGQERGGHDVGVGKPPDEGRLRRQGDDQPGPDGVAGQLAPGTAGQQRLLAEAVGGHGQGGADDQEGTGPGLNPPP